MPEDSHFAEGFAADQTWEALDQLLSDLGECARTDCDPAGFVDRLLQTVLTSLSAHRVSLWTALRGGGFAESGTCGGSQQSRHVDATGERRAELSLIERAVELGRAIAVLPQTQVAVSSAEISNPTEWTRLIAPIRSSKRGFGCICVWLSGEADPEIRSNSLKLLEAIAELSLPFFESQDLARLLAAEEFAARLQVFTAAIHSTPSPSTTPRTLAHQLRAIVGADRCWVLSRRGRRLRVVAADGTASLQRKSSVVRQLERLASTAALSGKVLDWSLGEQLDLERRVATQLEKYIDESNACRVRIQGVETPPGPTPAGKAVRRRTVGILVCEWFRPPLQPLAPEWWNAIAEQTSVALQNAEDWGRAPVARFLRPARRGLLAPRVIRNLLVIAGIALLAAAAVSVKTDLMLEVRGELQPVVRRHAFAAIDGTVRDVLVETGEHVRAGQALAVLDNTQIAIDLKRIEGDLLSAQVKRSAIEASRLDAQLLGGDSLARRNEMTSELEELTLRIENLEREQDLLKIRAAELEIHSPIDGEILSWDVKRELMLRPVSRGDILFTIAQTDGPWQLELQVPDSRVGDLPAAKNEVAIDYSLVTTPERVSKTRLASLSTSIESRTAGEEPSVLAFASVVSEDSGLREAGLGVRARFYCGRHPVGYVWLRDLWRTVRRDVLFRWGL